MMRPSGKLKRFMSNADYQVWTKRTKKKKSAFVWVGAAKTQLALPMVAAGEIGCADQTLLPLHLSFCLTTLKNDASGNDANGSVFFAFRTVTIDPRSTWIGLRPSSVRYTG